MKGEVNPSLGWIREREHYSCERGEQRYGVREGDVFERRE